MTEERAPYLGIVEPDYALTYGQALSALRACIVRDAGEVDANKMVSEIHAMLRSVGLGIDKPVPATGAKQGDVVCEDDIPF